MSLCSSDNDEKDMLQNKNPRTNKGVMKNPNGDFDNIYI
jgi:hypothetical protein